MKPFLMMFTAGVVIAGVAVGGYALVQNARNSAVEILPLVQPVTYTDAEEQRPETPGTTAETPEIVVEVKEIEPEPETETEEDIDETSTAPAGGLSGTYRCWSFNMNGAGGRCTSAPIVFSLSGTYSTSSEHGTYTVNGSSVFMSASKIRGTGALSADGAELMFNYTYNGNPYTITYLKQ